MTDAKIKAFDWFQKINETYVKTSLQTYFKGLVVGKDKSGKTYSLLTLPRPLLIDSFDPSGIDGEIDELARNPENGIFIRKYWDEDRKNPTLFQEWEADFELTRYGRFFDHITSYSCDTITSLLRLILNYETFSHPAASGYLKNKMPTQANFGHQLVDTIEKIGQILALPCHVIMTGHILSKMDKNQNVIQSVLMSPMMAGSVPSMFPNLLIAESVEIRDENYDYRWLTKPDDETKMNAGSRWNKKLDKYEPQDFRQLFAKIGIPWENKEWEKKD